MAVGFPKPLFDYDYDLAHEKAAFDRFFSDPVRAIPPKEAGEFDLASWNIANLGLQKRREQDLELIAHVLGHFDMIAVQEINEELDHLNIIMALLRPLKYEIVFTDSAGSQERLGVIYRTDLFRPGLLFGELDYNPNGKIVDGKYVIPPKKQTFKAGSKKFVTTFYNFNRNPFISTWQAIDSDLRFLLVNAHLYFGEDGDENPQFLNRVAEAYFLSQWASEQRRKGPSKVYESNIILSGDMNVPRMESDNPVYRALLRQGMLPTRYSTEAGTTTQDFNTYDQIIFTKETADLIKIKNQKAVVVDYDNFVFADLWQQVQAGTRTLSDFKGWVRFAVSDHRPMFVRLSV
jgi:hypothetical protein